MKKENESIIELEVGNDYISVRDNNFIVIDRTGDITNRGFDGNDFEYDLFCSSSNEWRDATKEEVIEAFEKHLPHRFGEDWETMKIKERHPDSILEINDSLWDVEISKSSRGWGVWNKHGLLYRNGIWVERLEEEKIHIKEAIKEKTAIHCETEEEAERILEMAHELGYRWINGEYYIDNAKWEFEKSKTCYCLFTGSYSSNDYYDYFKKNDYIIIPSTQIEDLVVEKKTVCTPVPEKNLDSFSDTDLVSELRKRGYEVTAERTIKL